MRSTRELERAALDRSPPPCDAPMALLLVGFTEPCRSPGTLVVSYTTVHPWPLPRGRRRSVLCGTVPRVTPGGCYPPPALWSPDLPRGVSSPRPPGQLIRSQSSRAGATCSRREPDGTADRVGLDRVTSTAVPSGSGSPEVTLASTAGSWSTTSSRVRVLLVDRDHDAGEGPSRRAQQPPRRGRAWRLVALGRGTAAPAWWRARKPAALRHPARHLLPAHSAADLSGVAVDERRSGAVTWAYSEASAECSAGRAPRRRSRRTRSRAAAGCWRAPSRRGGAGSVQRPDEVGVEQLRRASRCGAPWRCGAAAARRAGPAAAGCAAARPGRRPSARPQPSR